MHGDRWFNPERSPNVIWRGQKQFSQCSERIQVRNMKKIIVTTLALVFAFALCSCGVEPQDCKICELNYQIPGNYIQETDQDTANSNLKAAQSKGDVLDDVLVAEDDHDYLEVEDYLGVQWFDGDETDFVAEAVASSYNDNELDDAIKAAYSDFDNTGHESFVVGSLQGECGEMDDNFIFHILHNGVLYELVFFNQSADQWSEQAIDEFIAALSFDNGAMGTNTVDCGKVSIEVPAIAQKLATDSFDPDQYKDMSAFETYGDACVQFSINYFETNGVPISELTDYLKGNFNNPQYSEDEEDFGKCYYVSGEMNGLYEACALFEKDDVYYMIDVTSEDTEMTKADAQKYTKTIKSK